MPAKAPPADGVRMDISQARTAIPQRWFPRRLGRRKKVSAALIILQSGLNSLSSAVPKFQVFWVKEERFSQVGPEMVAGAGRARARGYESAIVPHRTTRLSWGAD